MVFFHRGRLVALSDYRQDWQQCCRNVPGVPLHHTVRTFKYAFNVIQNWETNALPILFNGACFLLAVVVEGYKRSQLRLAN